MKHISSILFFIFITLQITGCSGLAEMKETEFINSIDKDTAMVNFVRPRVFAGDGAKTELWDGDQFIGTLSAGSLIQYPTSPGEHTFMVYTQGSWGIAKGELIAGKNYFLKFNVGFGFVTLGPAKSTDPRIEQWKSTLTPMAIDPVKSKEVPAKYISKAQEMIKRVESNTAKYEEISELNAF